VFQHCAPSLSFHSPPSYFLDNPSFAVMCFYICICLYIFRCTLGLVPHMKENMWPLPNDKFKSPFSLWLPSVLLALQTVFYERRTCDLSG
jgi:hypothetical protein